MDCRAEGGPQSRRRERDLLGPGRPAAGQVSRDQSLCVWDTGSGQVLFTVKQEGHLTSLSFSPDGDRLATGGTDGIIRLYDTRSGQERAAAVQRR